MVNWFCVSDLKFDNIVENSFEELDVPYLNEFFIVFQKQNLF
jgi:hypothetical protein